jgi:hypothetical protein
MTTIAYKDGIMSSDSRAYSGGSTPIGSKKKIFKIETTHDETVLVGISTTVPGLSENMIEHISDCLDANMPFGGVPTDLSADDLVMTILMVRGNGDVYFARDSLMFTGPLDAEFYAIGSGEHYALAAMAMGAPAQRAVDVARSLDVWTDGPIVSIHQYPAVAADCRSAAE